MGKDVVVIASGETERRSLPHLVSHLQSESIFVVEVDLADPWQEVEAGCWIVVAVGKLIGGPRGYQ
ncbi:MAG: hypothetical protein ACLQIB_58450 [Isosphaeraceae bacterium]